jgi:hypothetical protein
LSTLCYEKSDREPVLALFFRVASVELDSNSASMNKTFSDLEQFDALAELFSHLLDTDSPQDGSIAHDFLAPDKRLSVYMRYK